LVHEELVIDTTPLNAEQRLAVASLIDRPLTVVTGPPGTGKSQVVSATAANARLQNQNVLFASRNHKAIDAVYNRLVDANGRPLMIRTNSKEDPNLNFTFSHAIKEMLRDQTNLDATQRLKYIKEENAQLLSKRGEVARIARQCANVSIALGEIEERKGYLGRGLPQSMVLFLEAKPSYFPHESISRISKTVHTLSLTGKRQSIAERVIKLLRCLSLLPMYRRVRKRLNAVPGSPDLPPWPTPNGLQSLFQDLPVLEKAVEYTRLRLKSIPLEDEARKLPPLEQLTNRIADMTKRLEEIAPRAIDLDMDSRRGLCSEADREEIAGLGPALRAMRTGLDEGSIRQEVIKLLKERTPYVLESFPCWAVTNLSAGSRLPMIAGMFDLVIVDEASQSDIPSAIPLLFRAKRAGVVGDPFQLTHCSKLSVARDTLLRREVGIKRVDDVRFAYSEHSLYDLFAGTRGVEPVFLSETYRSAPDIAGYSNAAFYNGRLRVATDISRLRAPYGFKPGIHWTEIVGEVQSGGGSGCFCPEEVDAVAYIVREMLIENDFRGTLGIVTPFRQQANRIRDMLYESDIVLYDALVASKTHIDTAHGFQGDERDVIILSICAGPEMPNGSKGFLRENPNLFNVAASRARAVLHIVGNRAWAIRSKIRHIERLASSHMKDTQEFPRGPWHPHESPWEKILFDALVAEGLNPRPQFSVASRRLDMALIKDGHHPLKIDIEVDGDCHRNPDGTRKLDDIWWDMQLKALGWKVLRFWTYKLRENLNECVQIVLKKWSENE
jgi:very-short-patch-repair endonuclease